MAIRVRVQNDLQIIVPVRVIRAVTGQPVIDAPEVDDRGWINHRAAGLNVADTRGALFGMTQGDTVRVKVIREDIDDAPQLFVSTTGNQVVVDSPAGGGPLGADGIFQVRAVADTTVASTVQIRLGSDGGPILYELDAHVFTTSTLNVTPHVCTIHQAATAAAGTGVAPTVNGNALDATQVNAIFDIVKAIWRPCGVDFNIGAIRQEVFTGFLTDDFASQNRPGVGSEENIVMGRNQVGGTCNIYFLRFMDRSLGVGVRVETRAGEGMTHSGILIGVEGSSRNAAGTNIVNRTSTGTERVHDLGNDVAHEIGHFLTLPHANNVNSPGLTDTYGRRRLMHPNNPLPAAVTPLTATSVPRFNDIGYGLDPSGRGRRGALITFKDHPSDASDGEVMSARRRFRSPNLFA